MLDRFNDYNQISLVVKDQFRTCLIIEQGPFSYQVIISGLTNILIIFQRVVINSFAKYLHDFMQSIFDDSSIPGTPTQHSGLFPKLLQDVRIGIGLN